MKIELCYKREFVRATLTVLVGGLIITILISYFKDSSRLLILGLVGSIIGTFIASFWNLIYLIPNRRVEFNLILPGILMILSMVMNWWSSPSDLYFFGTLGLLNLIIGLVNYWLLKQTIKYNTPAKDKKHRALLQSEGSSDSG